MEKVLPNNDYNVRRLGTNKTQLLHRIRLRKFTPQAALADIFVRETDWQKDDQTLLANDDLYAQSWNTSFGTNAFEDGPSEFSQDTDDAEYAPIQIPDDNHPPSPESSKNGGGAQWNRPLNPKEETMKILEKPMRMKQKTHKKPKIIKIIHPKLIPKKYQKTLKTPHCKKNL